MGCSLAASLVDLKKELKRSVDPDYLFLEPSEMIVTSELRNVMAMGLRDLQYTVGPLITLVDAVSFGFNWEEREQLISGQIRDTDRVVLSRADRVDQEEIERICRILQVKLDDLLLLSQNDGKGLEALGRELLSRSDT